MQPIIDACGECRADRARRPDRRDRGVPGRLAGKPASGRGGSGWRQASASLTIRPSIRILSAQTGRLDGLTNDSRRSHREHAVSRPKAGTRSRASASCASIPSRTPAPTRASPWRHGRRRQRRHPLEPALAPVDAHVPEGDPGGRCEAAFRRRKSRPSGRRWGGLRQPGDPSSMRAPNRPWCRASPPRARRGADAQRW